MGLACLAAESDAADPPTVYGDCAAVVGCWQATANGKRPVLGARHAGFAREFAGLLRNVAGVHKTKAHVDIGALQTALGTEAREVVEAKANACVDRFAKAAVEMLQCLPSGDRAALMRQRHEWHQVITLFLTLLPLWEPARVRHGTLVRARSGGSEKGITGRGRVPLRAEQEHSFVWSGGRWLCRGCHWVKLKSRSDIDRVPCSKVIPKMRGVWQTNHRVFITQSLHNHALLFFCKTCGCYGSEHPKDFLGPCLGKPSSKGQLHRLGRMLRCWHPKFDVPLARPWPAAIVREQAEREASIEVHAADSGEHRTGACEDDEIIGLPSSPPPPSPPEVACGVPGDPPPGGWEFVVGPEVDLWAEGGEEEEDEDVFGFGPCGW